jgi:hypothetical protein
MPFSYLPDWVKDTKFLCKKVNEVNYFLSYNTDSRKRAFYICIVRCASYLRTTFTSLTEAFCLA